MGGILRYVEIAWRRQIIYRRQVTAKNYKSYLDILKVIRQECASQVLEYIIDEEKSTVTIKPQDSKEVFAVIPTSEFNENATTLFDNIKKHAAIPFPLPIRYAILQA